MKYQVLIADADEQFRNQLVAALKECKEFKVTGIAADGKEALQMLQTKKVDILVMDLLLAEYDGLTLLELIQDMVEQPAVLAISAFISEYVAAAAMRRGAQQLLCKPCGADLVVKNLRRMIDPPMDNPVKLFWKDTQNLESLVTTILHEIGVPANLKGYQYLREAIMLAVKDKDRDAILRCRYKEIANIYETTDTKVERAIRGAILVEKSFVLRYTPFESMN